MGEVKLIETKVVQNGNGTMKDHVVDYIFQNNIPQYEDLVGELQRLAGYETVQKGTEEWLECTHEMVEVTSDTVTMRFTKPYCG